MLDGYRFHLVSLPQESYYVPYVPVNLSVTNILLINAGTLVVCILVMLYSFNDCFAHESPGRRFALRVKSIFDFFKINILALVVVAIVVIGVCVYSHIAFPLVVFLCVLIAFRPLHKTFINLNYHPDDKKTIV